MIPTFEMLEKCNILKQIVLFKKIYNKLRIKENQLKDLEKIVNNLRQNQNSGLTNESYLYFKRSEKKKIKEVENLIEVYSDLSIEILLYLNENKHLSLHNIYEIDAFLLNKAYLIFFFKIVNENYKFIRATRRIIYFTKDENLLQFKYNSKIDALLNSNIS